MPCNLVILEKKSLLAPSYEDYVKAWLYCLFDRGGLLILGNEEAELFSSIHLYQGTSLCLKALQSQNTVPESFESNYDLGQITYF